MEIIAATVKLSVSNRYASESVNAENTVNEVSLFQRQLNPTKLVHYQVRHPLTDTSTIIIGFRVVRIGQTLASAIRSFSSPFTLSAEFTTAMASLSISLTFTVPQE
jgi:hypothetical protein